MKIITLNEQEFDRFANNHRYKNYYQTSSYGKLMSRHGFKIHYIGITDDLNHLIGASLLIYTTVFMNKKIAYAPGGILFDYSISANVETLVKKLKQVLKHINKIVNNLQQPALKRLVKRGMNLQLRKI